MQNFIQSLLILYSAGLVSTTGAEHVVYAQVGEKVTLSSPEVDSPFLYVYWKFGQDPSLQLGWRNHLGGLQIMKEKPWDNIIILSNHSLVINNIQPDNFGTFVCEILFKEQGRSTSNMIPIRLIKLTVSANPTSLLLPGDALSLACSVEAHAKPEIFWLNPRGERRTNPGQGALTIRANSRDHGLWTCVVANEKQAKISVSVMDLSPAPLRPLYTSTSTALTVPCSIPAHITWEQIKEKGGEEVHWQFFPTPSSDPQKLFSLSLKDPPHWSPKQGRDLSPASDPKTRVLSLSRKYGREEDGGDYVCSMTFRNGVTLNRTVHVDVLQIISSSGTNLIRGQPLNLTCSTGHPLPSDLRLQWSPPVQSSLRPLGSERHPARLTIPQVFTGDGGNWGCALWQGETQLTSAVITLKIEHKLSVWMLVIICGAAVIVILLGILIFILYRRRNRKMRHLRHQLCRCKNPKPKGFYRT